MDTVTIRLTTPLRRFVGGQHEVKLPARSVAEALQQLGALYPDLRGRLVDADGSLREFVQVHVGKTPLRMLGGLPSALKPGDVVSLSSPFSGG
jgi:molybdopterin converting factor small subunit